VIGDPRRLKQVFTYHCETITWKFGPDFAQVLVNLVNNGIKFTETGSVVVSVDVKQETSDCCEFMFNVSDTGMSIVPSSLFLF
jgi:signal transduction histidine kinase